MIASVLVSSVEMGLLYAVAVFGVYLTFRVLDFPDLTIDGSFVMGAIITALAIIHGIPGLPALFFGFLAGCVAGMITATLHTYFCIGKILSGILSVSILYTLNLRLMGGPNISLLNQEGIFSLFQTPFDHLYLIIFLFCVVTLLKIFIDWFLSTEFGLQLRTTGDSESVAHLFAINTRKMKYVGISISNGFIGLAGGLIAQYQGFVDIHMGVGMIILGITALMLGEILIVKTSVRKITFAIVLGAILYQLVIHSGLQFGLPGTDLKLVTACLLIATLLFTHHKKYFYA